MTSMLEVSDFVDFDTSKVLKKGERAPKGWTVVLIKAEHLPAGWPKGKPYKCTCGCGVTMREGDRVAVKNPRTTGGVFVNRVKP